MQDCLDLGRGWWDVCACARDGGGDEGERGGQKKGDVVRNKEISNSQMPI